MGLARRIIRTSWKALSSQDARYAVRLLSAEFNPFSAKRRRPLISRTIIYTRDQIKRPDVEVGEFTYGTLTIVRRPDGGGSRVKIGKFCALGDLTIELRGSHHMEFVSAYGFIAFPDHWPAVEHLNFEDVIAVSRGDVVIGNDVWFGIDVTVLSGVTIGDGAVIGAKSVVTRDVEPYAIVAGNPARLVRKRFDEDTIQRLLETKWWDWPVERINRNLDVICSGDVSRLFDL